MKILVIHNQYQQFGGEKVAVEAQLSLLREKGQHLILYFRDNHETESYRLYQWAAFFPETVYSRRTVREIRELVNQERPDVAHIHNVFPLISPSVYKTLNECGIPIVQTVHNFRFLCLNGVFYTHGNICERCKFGNTLHGARLKCYRESYVMSALYALTIGLHRRCGTFQHIDRFIALSQFTANKLVESRFTSAKKITVLGNFLPNPLPLPGSLEDRQPFIIYLGRLSPEKGVETLIEALSSMPELYLKILGHGLLFEPLQKMVAEKNLRNVEFLGHTTGETKWALLREAMICVLPSVSYEQFPLAILESWAVGTPALAADLGSLPFILEDGKTGLLFRGGDPMDLRQKITWMVNHTRETMIMGVRGRETLENRYSADAHYEQLMAIYDNLKAFGNPLTEL